MAGQGLDQLPLPLIAQALTLPVLFGALSQAVSFRRSIKHTRPVAAAAGRRT